MTNSIAPCVLSIAGLDPSGGAGLLADARAISAFGAFACGAATAIVPQNTRGVTCCDAVQAELLAAQLDAIFDDLKIGAVKIGLVPNEKIAQVTAARVLRWREEMPRGAVVFDTVFAPSSGDTFCDENDARSIALHLLPHCDLVTPNLNEAALLLGARVGEEENQMREAAAEIAQVYGAPRVLIKGGHRSGEALDVLFDATANHSQSFVAPRVPNVEVRGTGCLLSSAIAAQLAQNTEMQSAIAGAKSWLTERIAQAQSLGAGRRVAVF